MKTISEKTVLVQMHISVWTGKVKDTSVTLEVCSEKGSETDAGTWQTNLVPKQVIQKVEAAAARCRAVHNEWTLPWLDGGVRVLPATAFMDYTADVRKAKDFFDKEVSIFLDKYPELVATATKRLGKLIKGAYLPDIKYIKDRFGVATTILPFPNSKDFRVDLGDATEEIKQQVENNIKEMGNLATKDLWERMGSLVHKIKETLSQPDKIFRNSLIENLEDFCKKANKLNFTDDENLENIRKEVFDTLAKLKPDDLREDKESRKDAAKKASDLIEKMKSYM